MAPETEFTDISRAVSFSDVPATGTNGGELKESSSSTRRTSSLIRKSSFRDAISAGRNSSPNRRMSAVFGSSDSSSRSSERRRGSTIGRLTLLNRISNTIRNSDSLDKSSAISEERSRALQALDGLVAVNTEVPLSKLALVKKLGEGAFAEVMLYEVVPDEGSQMAPMKVAVKVMRDRIPGPIDPMTGEHTMVAAPAEWRANFKTEAVLMRELRHVNVVRCYGMVDTGDERLMLVQEFCGGGDLQGKINRATFTVNEGLGWLINVAAGMEYLHGLLEERHTVAHRDLKPENVLLDEAGVAKVADFGLFRMHEAMCQPEPSAEVAADAAPPASLSVVGKKRELTGQTGSNRYMAPEVFANAPYDSKVDVFSFAIVAFEVLSRSRAYGDSHLSPEQIPAAVHRTPTFRPKLPKRWTEEVVTLFEAMWAAEPAERPDFTAIMKELSIWRKIVAAPRAEGEAPPELLTALSPPPGCCTIL